MTTSRTMLSLTIEKLPTEVDLMELVTKIASEYQVAVLETEIKKKLVLQLTGPARVVSKARKDLQRRVAAVGGVLQIR